MSNRLVVALVALAAGASSPRHGGSPPFRVPCDDPAVDRWVTDMRDRVTSFDALGLYAIERFGPPRACDGSVTSEFDGMKFGILRLDFTEDVTFVAETMPPEASVVTLRVPSGVDDEDAARRILERYTADVGVEIDWSVPTLTEEGEERIQTFRDPDDGLNASASLFFHGGALVGLRFSLAL